MPYDDTDVKKMIKYQTERKVGFSRHRKISAEAKELIHGILEAKTDRRFSISDVRQSTWMTTHAEPLTTTSTTTTRDDPNDGQQSDSVGAGETGVTVVETDRLLDQCEQRASISVNNNNVTVSKLPRLMLPAVQLQRQTESRLVTERTAGVALNVPRWPTARTATPTSPLRSLPFRARTSGR